MTLLITVLAAVFSTALWYGGADGKMKFGTLSLFLWGASIMWSVDFVADWIEGGADFFGELISNMAADAFLGFFAVAIAAVIWILVLLFCDPKKSVFKK